MYTGYISVITSPMDNFKENGSLIAWGVGKPRAPEPEKHTHTT
jgi:hypothetical protein